MRTRAPTLMLALLAGVGIALSAAPAIQKNTAAPEVVAPPLVSLEAVQVPAPYVVQMSAESPILVTGSRELLAELGILETRVRPRARQWRAQAGANSNELRGSPGRGTTLNRMFLST